jgi:hypothetical protein
MSRITAKFVMQYPIQDFDVKAVIKKEENEIYRTEF